MAALTKSSLLEANSIFASWLEGPYELQKVFGGSHDLTQIMKKTG